MRKNASIEDTNKYMNVVLQQITRAITIYASPAVINYAVSRLVLAIKLCNPSFKITNFLKYHYNLHPSEEATLQRLADNDVTWTTSSTNTGTVSLSTLNKLLVQASKLVQQ